MVFGALELAWLIIIILKWTMLKELIWSWVYGLLFGVGLVIAGMCRVSKIIYFLTIDKDLWDPSLAFVMGAAVAINVVTFHLILKREKPTILEKFELPKNTKIEVKLIAGAAIFGLGWGIGGLCPGPGMVTFFTNT